jgi:hypothetical protein
VGLTAFLYPVRQVTLVAGPGLEWKHYERNAMLRLGGLYEIPYKGWVVSPTAYLDLVRGGEQLLVLGVTIGTSF